MMRSEIDPDVLKDNFSIKLIDGKHTVIGNGMIAPQKSIGDARLFLGRLLSEPLSENQAARLLFTNEPFESIIKNNQHKTTK